MQYLKEEIRRLIVTVAREEFIEHGVRETSIRTIAKRSGVAVGTIYRYFTDKDALFRAVLTPLLKELDRYLSAHNDKYFLDLRVFRMPELSLDHQLRMKELIKAYRPELRLLLFHCEGSSLEHFMDRIIATQTEIGNEYLRLMKERYPHLEVNISPFLIHILCSSWASLFAELVVHDEYTDEEIDLALNQYSRYGMAGWTELLKPFETINTYK